MGKRARLLTVIGAVALVLGLSLLVFGNRRSSSRYAVAAADRGDISDVVGATGVLQAVTTVQVGSQVSGTIQSLFADFNSTVKKDQVVARLDPALFEARLAQAQANLAAARANVERSQAAVDDARQKYERAKELAGQNLLPQSDLESAKATFDGAVAQDRANRSAVAQADASVNQARLDLEHTVIQAPIDGVVLARNVDVGQTVAASLQAPTLFVIANDLTQMEVNASIDEADIGRVRAGQPVSFRVDAFPDAIFAGTVKQVRLQPITSQNVVTYNTIIGVENPGQRLMPGMTATVSVIVDSRSDVLRVPAAALRFRPEGFQERTGARAGAAGRGGAQERDGATARDATARGSGGREGAAPPAKGPGRSGLVFVLGDDGRPQPTRVRLGLSDGQHAEVLEGLTEGTQVVTGLEAQAGSRAASRPGPSPSANNPFAPQRPQPRAR
jgi:HlyD family secretion protein